LFAELIDDFLSMMFHGLKGWDFEALSSRSQIPSV
jgi:hypothetical protein